MSHVTVKKIEDIGYHQGENAVVGVRFRHAARDLGVTAFGMNVLEVDAGCTLYPEHDHGSDGQEEVYVILKGSATLDTGDEAHLLGAGTLVRVGAAQRRKFLPGPDGVTLLAIGATPGQPYGPRR